MGDRLDSDWLGWCEEWQRVNSRELGFSTQYRTFNVAGEPEVAGWVVAVQTYSQ